MNENKVRVTANEHGEVVNVSANNPKYGFIRVTQERAMTDDNGFLRVRSLSALIPGEVEMLRKLGWVNGQYVSGKIVVREQLVPFNKTNPEKDIKIAGDTKIVCKVGDQPIYRNTVFSFTLTTPDVLLAHTNTEEIKDAYKSSLVAEEEDHSTVDQFSLDK